MIKIIEHIINFFKGFKLINYEYELASKPVYTGSSLILKMSSLLGRTFKIIHDAPADNIRFGIRSYTIEKVDNSVVESQIRIKGECVSFTKVSTIFVPSACEREIDVTNTIFSLGLDNKLWKFQFKTYSLYNSSSSEFDDKFIEFCIELSNNCIEALNLNAMCKYKISVSPIYEEEQLATRKFEGNVSTYGNFDDTQIYGINELLPNPVEKEPDVIIESIHEEKPEKILNDDSLLFDVIRRKKPRSELDEETRQALENFNIDVISKKTVGELQKYSEILKSEHESEE